MKWYRPSEKAPPAPEKYYNGDWFIGVFKGTMSIYITKVQAVFEGLDENKILYIENNENPAYWDENQLIAWTPLESLREDFNKAMPEYSFY
jgi:hypothetical protein